MRNDLNTNHLYTSSWSVQEDLDTKRDQLNVVTTMYMSQRDQIPSLAAKVRKLSDAVDSHIANFFNFLSHIEISL